MSIFFFFYKVMKVHLEIDLSDNKMDWAKTLGQTLILSVAKPKGKKQTKNP
jgi:hypothetical protein